MRMVRPVFTLLCVLSMIASLSFVKLSLQEASAQTKILKIGLITSVTGLMAPGFRQVVDAAKPAADYLNQKGGITVKGEKYRIETITTDDQSSPQGAVSAANKLIQDGVKFIIAPIFHPSNIAIASICEEAKILRLVPISANPESSGPPNKYSFNGESTSCNVPYVYEKIKALYPRVKRIAITLPDDPGGKLVMSLVEKEVKKWDMEIVFSEAYRVPTEDFYPLLTKALAQKPDAIECIYGIVPFIKAIVEQAREMGFTGPISSVAPSGDVNQLKDALAPEYAYDVCMVTPDVLSEGMPTLVKDFGKIIQKATRDKYNFAHVFTLQAVWQIAQGIEKAQSFETDKVVSALENAKSIETPYGPGRFIGQEIVGKNRLFLRPIPFSRLMKGGKMETELLPVKY